MNTNNPHIQIVAQWITSIAISVICCAVLFIVFAGYIVDLNSAINLVSVRLEVAQEKYANLYSEVETLKKTLVLQAEGVTPGPASPVAAQDQPPSSGVEISGPAPTDPDAKNVEPAVAPAAQAPQSASPAAAPVISLPQPAQGAEKPSEPKKASEQPKKQQ